MSTKQKHVENSELESKANPSEIPHVGWLALAIVLAIFGWGGLSYLATNVYPTVPWARLAFLVAWGAALMGTVWPVLLALNQRLNRRVTAARVWRQSGWIAAFGVLAAWLQMKPNRVLTIPLALTIAAIFTLVEVMMILREREKAGEDDE